MKRDDPELQEELCELLQWSRDGIGGLWNETAELRRVVEETRDQFSASQLGVEDTELGKLEEEETLRTRDAHFERELKAVRDGLGYLEDSSLRVRDSFSDLQERVWGVREEMLDDLRHLRDELRSIQTSIQIASGKQQRMPESSVADGFLMNWMKQERGAPQGDDEPPQKVFAPLLTKKQRLAMQRADTNKQDRLVSSNRSQTRRGKRGRGAKSESAERAPGLE
ncbi:hypothetical protein C8F01DRAFT_1360878 [Mycena amicta]|nr:hypothetical protein C8F01DRAFT_1360878 [Mycena amicta]